MTITVFATPPRDLIASWLPELIDSHDTVRQARQAVQESLQAVKAAQATNGAGRVPGGDWTTAEAKDDQLIEQGKPAKWCAQLVAERPVREQQAAALQRRHARLAAQWDTAAHRQVSDAAREAITSAELDSRGECFILAKTAIGKAANGKPADRLAESLAAVADLRRELGGWRDLRGLQLWLNFGVWEPHRYADAVPLDDTSATPAYPGRPDTATHSIGIVEEALSLADDRLRHQLTYRRRADGKDLVRP